jgi:hypothetical protein
VKRGDLTSTSVIEIAGVSCCLLPIDYHLDTDAPCLPKPRRLIDGQVLSVVGLAFPTKLMALWFRWPFYVIQQGIVDLNDLFRIQQHRHVEGLLTILS